MKKNISLIILIVCIIIVSIPIYLHIKNNKNYDVLSDEKNQVELLQNIYLDFLNNNNNNLSLDSSCLKNLITGNEFSEKNKNILKSVESFNNDASFSYILISNYNVKNSILTLTLKRNDGNETRSQKYKLYVKNNLLNYDRDGFGTNSYSQPTN
ncbi:MAG: hypothetical protein IJX34_01050 [Clostridia bacterium]|nr:hypothetical protein [Clostridia bacterium]